MPYLHTIPQSEAPVKVKEIYESGGGASAT
jgi:hypothetical protein